MKKILIRLFIFIFIILAFLKGVDIFCYYNKETIEEQCENQLVNRMNGEKLTVNYVERIQNDYTILHKNEKIPEKGNKKRILVVGDSLIWGHANRNHNTLFWTRLNYLLEQEGYNDVEVYAAGVSGIGTVDEVNMILKNNRTIRRIDPDLIIVGLVLNDLIIDNINDKNYIKQFDESKFIEDHYDNFIFNSIKKMYPYLYDRLINSLVIVPSNTEEFNVKYGEKYGYGYDYRDSLYRSEKYKKLFEEQGIKEIANLNIPTIIYELYFGFSEDYEMEFLNYAKDISIKNGVQYYEIRDKLEEYFMLYEDNWFGQNEEDGHPSELLNNIYAEEMLNILKSDYPDLLGKKTKLKEPELIINDYMPYSIDLKKEADNLYTFIYPSNVELLTFPLNTDFIKLNLKYPMKFNSISIESNNIKKVDIWYNKYMEDKNYRKLKSIGNEFIINGDEVFSLNIHIEKIDTKSNQKIYIRFK